MKKIETTFLIIFILLLVLSVNQKIFAQSSFFPSLPVVKTGFEYGTKTVNLFDEDLDTLLEYDYKNFQIQLIQQIFDKIFWNFKYKIQDYLFYDDFTKNKTVNYFYNNLKFKMLTNFILSIEINYKFSDFDINSKDYNYFYPGFSLKYNFKKSSYMYFSYHLYYRYGSLDYYDYQIHRFYFTFKYSLNKISFKLNGSYNYQINFDNTIEKYNKFSIGAFITYDFNG